MSKIVYFIKPVGMDGPIKIGCSRVPEERLESLTVWSPFPLEILATAKGGYDVERKLHARFAFTHSHREWFHAVPELNAAIAQIAAGAAIEDAVDLSKVTGSIHAKANREPWGAGRRRYMSWIIRLHAAERRAKKHFGCSMWMPERAWDLANKMQDIAFQPSDEDIAYLEGIAADPIGWCLNAAQRWPRSVASIERSPVIQSTPTLGEAA